MESLKHELAWVEQFALRGRWEGARESLRRAGEVIDRMATGHHPVEPTIPMDFAADKPTPYTINDAVDHDKAMAAMDSDEYRELVERL